MKRLYFLSLWEINDELIPDKLKKLTEMKAAGFDGTIFYLRCYLGKPVFMGKEYLEMPMVRCWKISGEHLRVDGVER